MEPNEIVAQQANISAFDARDPSIPLDRSSRQQRVRAVLMTYCDPKLKYDGFTAWEIAGKILTVLDEEPEPTR